MDDLDMDMGTSGDDEDAGVFESDDSGGIFSKNNFEDNESIFSQKTVDQRSPLTTKAADEQRFQEPEPLTLVCVFDAEGKPAVARFEGRRRVEAWRRPTPPEVEFLQAQGKLVRGGVETVAGAGAEPAPAKGFSVMKAVIGLAVVGAVGYGAWRLYRYSQEEAEADVYDV